MCSDIFAGDQPRGISIEHFRDCRVLHHRFVWCMVCFIYGHKVCYWHSQLSYAFECTLPNVEVKFICSLFCPTCHKEKLWNMFHVLFLHTDHSISYVLDIIYVWWPHVKCHFLLWYGLPPCKDEMGLKASALDTLPGDGYFCPVCMSINTLVHL